MTRSLAILVLTGFALLFSLVSYFGFQEVGQFLRALNRCENPAFIDNSSLWFGGFLCFTILPLMALTRQQRWHCVALALMILVFFIVPALLHFYVVNSAQNAGYQSKFDSGLYRLERVEYQNSSC